MSAVIAVTLSALFAIPITLVGPVSAQSSAPAPYTGFTELTGTLPSIPPGQPWRIRVPNNWNGILLSDMDYANAADGAKYMYFLEQGYAESGIQRVNPYRQQHYDPAREISDMVTVINIFKSHFGKPRYVIQMGLSGGGTVTVNMADYPGSDIDGAVAWAPHDPVSYENQSLDRWFVLKMLLAPQRTDLWPENPLPPFSATDSATQGALWQPVIDAAQATPQGRARIALAATISEFSLWAADSGCANGASPPCPEFIDDNGIDGTYPRPDARDVNSLEASMYWFIRPPESLGGFDGGARYQFENACGGNLSWNTGVNYAQFFKNGNAAAKRTTELLYKQAGLSLKHDLALVNAGPRVPQNPAVIACWSAPDRNVRGDPLVPLLRVDSIGDAVPVAHMQAYACLVRQNHDQKNYGALFMNHAGHTRGTLPEQAAALTVLVNRLETGKWNTNPEHANQIADNIFPGTTAQYVNFATDPLGPVGKFNRTFTPAGAGHC